MLAIQRELLSGKSFAQLTAEYGLKFTLHPKQEEYPLVICNYSQIDSKKGCEVADDCRGLVLEMGTWNVVARAFSRFYNAGERPDHEEKNFIWDQQVTVTEKIDGSLLLIYWYKDRWHYNTRSTFCNLLVQGQEFTWEELAKTAFLDAADDFPFDSMQGMTLVFELVSPFTKVVTEYQWTDAFLLTAFIPTGELGMCFVDQMALGLEVRRPPRHCFSCLNDAVALFPECDPTFEGFVFRDRNNLRLKVKNPRYVELHYLKGNGNLALAKHLVPIILRNEQAEVLTHFPEYAPLVTLFEGVIQECIADVEDMLKKGYKEARKAFACSLDWGNKLSSCAMSEYLDRANQGYCFERDDKFINLLTEVIDQRTKSHEIRRNPARFAAGIEADTA